MSAIDFVYPCPACKTKSPQTAKKPSYIQPVAGWIKCPECECELFVQLLFDTKNRQADGRPKLQIATLKVKQSKKHKERIEEQKRNAANAKVILPPGVERAVE